MTFIKEWVGKEWVGLGIQKELKIYPCMGFTFCQNCPFQTCFEIAKAFPAPFCEGKLKPRVEIGKIICEAIDFQSY
jgi:hypothetical protein